MVTIDIQKKVATTPYPKKIRRFHHISFRYAISGLRWAFMTQPNLRIHLILFIIAISLGSFFSFYGMTTVFDFVAIILVSGMVMVAEMINTSLEALSDEVASSQYKDGIRITKDTASGAVFVASFFAVLVGVVIFTPKIFLLLYRIGYIK